MNNKLKIGIIILLILLLVTLVSIMFFEFDIKINMTERFEGFFGKHIFGTDNLGRDLWSSTLFGLWFSILTSILIVVISSFIGITIGIITGYFEGFLEILFLRIGDILLAFPGFLLIIIWMTVLGNGFFTMIFAISFTGWIEYARLIRGEVLKYKKKEFVIAARSYNASFLRIIFTHIFPHLLPVILVHTSICLSNVILIESSLNFLGLGVDSEIPTLGQMVFNGQSYLFQKPSLVIFPGLILFFLILAINFIGEGLRLRERS